MQLISSEKKFMVEIPKHTAVYLRRNFYTYNQMSKTKLKMKDGRWYYIHFTDDIVFLLNSLK